jgi:NTE family protein
MGVDTLIVVDVSFPLYARDELASPLEVTNQAFAIMIRSRTLEPRAKLQSTDVIIDPPLGRFASVDFTRVPQALSAGEQAAEAARLSLAPLSLSEVDYTAYLAARVPRTGQMPTVQFVRTNAQSSDYAHLVEATMADIVGQSLDTEVIADHLSSLYALDLFESIDYSLVEAGNTVGLELNLRRKTWGPNYVRFGLNLEDDFEGNSRYNAALRFISTEINKLGAEWLTDVQIGENPRLFSEFYQPLSLASRYFFAPHLEFDERSVYQRQGNHRMAEYRVRSYEAGLDFGRELSNWGEIRFGARRGSGRSHVLIGDQSLETDEFERGGFFAKFSYDKLDSIFFPRRGQQFEFEWRGERDVLGADQNFDTFSASWLFARSFDRHTFIFWTDFGTTVDDLATPEDFFTLGGFFNLSGLPPRFLAGPHYGIGRLIYYRQIGRRGAGVLDLPVYAGLSLEAGNTWSDRDDVSSGGLRKDASLFVGVDTPLGPVYLATGFDKGGDKAFYLFLGRTF